MKRVTIKDVAKRAGVTHATVSLVIHDDKRITAETRNKVQKAIKELKYYPNQSARRLVTGVTNTIAIVMRRFYSMFGLEILSGLEEDVLKTHYDLNLYSSKGGIQGTDTIFYEILHEKKADAVIALGINCSSEVVKDYVDDEIPLVLIEGSGEGAHIVKVNNEKGSYEATKYLIESGRKRIGFVIGNNETSVSQRERFAGYKKALEDFSVPFDNTMVKEVTDHSFVDGQNVFKALMDNKVDSVFCAAGDWVAAGVFEEAKRQKISVPDDLFIIGNDNMDIASALDLTTVAQPNSLMGKTAFEIALESIKKQASEPTIKSFEPELIIRHST